MEIRQVGRKETGYLFKNYMKEYFPANELKPLAQIRQMMKKGFYRVIALYEDGIKEPLGGAFLMKAPDGGCYLLDYLFVADGLRSGGYGSALLKEAAQNFADGMPVLIETETPASATTSDELAQRKKRDAFYERNGAVKSDLIALIFGAEYTIWILNGGPIDIAAEYEKLYRFMISDILYKRFVEIPAKHPSKPERSGYSFFQNRSCEYFPCHTVDSDEDFNCLFCYCPLYMLGDKCGGNFIYLENGIKSCENCTFPHKRENYDKVNARFCDIANAMRKE